MRRGEKVQVLGCRDDRQDLEAVSLELGADHRVAATTSATRRDVQAAEELWIGDDDGYEVCHETRVSLAATSRWSGSWTADSATAMTLDLRLADSSCDRAVEPPSSPTDVLPCVRPSKQLRLHCRLESLPIDGPEFPAGDRSVWRCRGYGLAESEGWVFGATGCIHVIDAQGPRPERIVDCGRTMEGALAVPPRRSK
jgi:hypothetical protein